MDFMYRESCENALAAAIKEYLPNRITKIDCEIVPKGFVGDIRTVRMYLSLMSNVLNKLGEESASTQGLNKVITTSERLRNSDHVVYLLKEETNEGAIQLIGYIKVGRKRLYLFNKSELVTVEPLCVLDFYIRPEYQRRGYGKELFDYMIKDNNVNPQNLAVDGPSSKMVAFMKHHFGMTIKQQSNNFAIDEAKFFSDELGELSSGDSSKNSERGRKLVGRYAAYQGTTSIQNIIHDKGPDYTKRELPMTPDNNSPLVGRYSAPKPRTSMHAIIHGGDDKNTNRKSSPRTHVQNDHTEINEEMSSLHINESQRPTTLDVGDERNGKPLAVEIPQTPNDGNIENEVDSGSLPPQTDSESPELTRDGFFDIKFYHHRLW